MIYQACINTVHVLLVLRYPYYTMYIELQRRYICTKVNNTQQTPTGCVVLAYKSITTLHSEISSLSVATNGFTSDGHQQ